MSEDGGRKVINIGMEEERVKGQGVMSVATSASRQLNRGVNRMACCTNRRLPQEEM